LRAPEIANLLSSLRNGLNDGIQQLHLWLPTLLLDLSIDDLTRDAEIRRTSLLRICHSTGVHAFRVDNTITSDEYKHNIRELTRKLTALCDACAGIRAVMTTHERFINVVNEFAKLDGALQNHWGDDLDFASNLLQGVKSKMAYVTESSQGQIHAMNSLIAQEDSAIHARYADLSGRIADHSQKIAEFTRRDSIDMRSVSVLMMAFFPATFLAVCYSSNHETHGSDKRCRLYFHHRSLISNHGKAIECQDGYGYIAQYVSSSHRVPGLHGCCFADSRIANLTTHFNRMAGAKRWISQRRARHENQRTMTTYLP
jgi:hypothetical protein